MLPDIVYITPSFVKDIGRFALLRESMQIFSPNIRHIVYVDTEDLTAFERRFKNEKNLVLIPTCDILPKAVEKERRLWRSRLGDLTTRAAHRMKLQRPYSGWKLQQLVKLEALARLDAEAAIFLDSDLLFCRQTEARDYFHDQKLIMLETEARTYEDFAFEVARQALFKKSMLEPMVGYNYIHQAPRFLARTGHRFVAMMEQLGQDWHQKFLGQFMPSEYNLLGYVARDIEKYEGYQPDRAGPQAWTYEVKTADQLEAQLAACRSEAGRRGFLLIQSNMQMPEAEYSETVREILRQIAQAPGQRATAA